MKQPGTKIKFTKNIKKGKEGKESHYKYTERLSNQQKIHNPIVPITLAKVQG